MVRGENVPTAVHEYFSKASRGRLGWRLEKRDASAEGGCPCRRKSSTTSTTTRRGTTTRPGPGQAGCGVVFRYNTKLASRVFTDLSGTSGLLTV